MKCPCHSGMDYESCCGPFHKGESPPDALRLMRSRYSAYALKNIDYILKTTHPDNAHSQIPQQKRRAEIGAFCTKTEFRGLEILDFYEEGETAFVTFRAILFQKKVNVSFQEKSKFLKNGGQWQYVSGQLES